MGFWFVAGSLQNICIVLYKSLNDLSLAKFLCIQPDVLFQNLSIVLISDMVTETTDS